MREAFLLQMNEFDRFLEIELQHMLDPVVAVQPPARGGRKRARKLFLAIVAPAIDLAVEAIPVVEPVVVTVPVSPARSI